jgi:hypothetical protein
MYTLTEQDLKSIKAAFGNDQPSINGVSITDLIIELSEINNGQPIVNHQAEVETSVVEALVAEVPVVDSIETPTEAPIEKPTEETAITDATA